MLVEIIVVCVSTLTALLIIREPWRGWRKSPEEMLPPADVVSIHGPKIASVQRRLDAAEHRITDLENAKNIEGVLNP